MSDRGRERQREAAATAQKVVAGESMRPGVSFSWVCLLICCVVSLCSVVIPISSIFHAVVSEVFTVETSTVTTGW